MTTTALALTALVSIEPVSGEADLLRELQTWAIPGRAVGDVIRGVTGTEVVLAVGAVIAALHWLSRARTLALVLAALLVLTPLTQTAVKTVVDRPRPAEAGVEATVSGSSPSFPAGHVMSPTVVYGWTMLQLLHRESSRPARRAFRGGALGRLRPVAAGCLGAVLVLSAIVSVQSGAHWPTDVLGGYLWGLVLLLPALYLYCRLQERRRGAT